MDPFARRIRQHFFQASPPAFPDDFQDWRLNKAFEETSFFEGKGWDGFLIDDFDR
ncbi:hypothetical protein [uncultured Tateyamaria sp.]|uniref:hypothetical protein n=1 Tax=uncultured Tateyamaria sp. TaxID=455651 RepID=UPI0026169DDD|nr:hypothetical protein [uncultured Tateyamaria sp.]